MGRRRGYQSQAPDNFEEWRIWPFHAVSGETAAGRTFTSARILDPQPKFEVDDGRATVTVGGPIPQEYTGYGRSLTGTIRYDRKFRVDAEGVSIETKVKADGADKLDEMYETLPVFRREERRQPEVDPPVIELIGGETWTQATPEPAKDVAAIRIKRFNGAVRIVFDRPRNVRLSPEVWQDTFQTRASCRTILIDLLEGAGPDFREATISYTIRPDKAEDGGE
jgi:hypothetical protein